MCLMVVWMKDSCDVRASHEGKSPESCGVYWLDDHILCSKSRTSIWRITRANFQTRKSGDLETHGRVWQEEFDELLALGPEDFACLTQMSYLKHLMGDTSGALEYARWAKCLEREPEDPEYLCRRLMSLGFQALPDAYFHWFENTDEPFTVWLAKIKTDTISGSKLGTPVTVLNEGGSIHSNNMFFNRRQLCFSRSIIYVDPE